MHPWQPPDPTADEIHTACEAIQAAWSPDETRRRIVGPKPAWQPLVIRGESDDTTCKPLEDD